MVKETVLSHNKSVRVAEAFLGMLPFLLWGLVCLENHFAILNKPPMIWTGPFFIFYALMLVGLGAGTMAGFPRWTYPYAFWSALAGMWLSSYSYEEGNLNGIVSSLPLVVLGLALVVRRSLAPLKNMLAGLVKDSTLFSLAAYTFVVWLTLLYDENQHPYLAAFILGSTLAVCTGVWLYISLKPAMHRVLAMASSLIIITFLSILNSLTWDWRAHHNLPASEPAIDPSGWVILVLIVGLMLLSGYLSQRRQGLEREAL